MLFRSKRPLKLEKVKLTAWAAWYDSCSDKSYVKGSNKIDIDGLPLESVSEQNDDEYPDASNQEKNNKAKANKV